MPNTMKAHAVGPCSCPYCGRKVEAMSGGESVPRDGDVAICINCHGVQVLEGGTLRQMAGAEFNKLMDEGGPLRQQFLQTAHALMLLDRMKHLRS